MDTLSMVSKYLNDLEEYLDDEDSMDAKKITVEKSEKELEMFEALGYKSVVVESKKHRVIVFTKAPPRAYSKTFMRVDYGDYGRKGEPSVLFGRDFLVTSKSKVDFRMGEMRIDITMLEEERDMDSLLLGMVENIEEVGSSNGELVKTGKASRNKGHNQKEKIKEVLEKKYKELEESKPIMDTLENYITYRKKLDEVMMKRARLSNNEFSEEYKMRIVKHGLPKKMCDPRNFMLPVSVIGTVQMNALADMRAIVSVFPFSLYKNLGLSDHSPYHSNLTMADNTQAKATGEVRNVRIQIRAVIGAISIADGVIHHTYFPKPRAKAYMENFKINKEDDWLSCFEVGHDEDGNPKYGLVEPSFLDIEDEMERALAMEAYFNPFKNKIVFKKLVDFLGSLPVQLKIPIGTIKKIRKPTKTNPRTSLIKEPLMRIMHRLIVGSLVHRLGSKERCQKRGLWMMSALEESRSINLAWVIAEHFNKHASRLKENSLIYGGHYMTKIAKLLGVSCG
uniref:Reverse transcriptase domain-containing protein n=1 Tax=Tanacetum cinerariifolium TaxID=118510 RepID=A0A699GXX4_TANCI|nr:hypothetical protein [Tanacetum cinerariifolium]